MTKGHDPDRCTSLIIEVFQDAFVDLGLSSLTSCPKKLGLDDASFVGRRSERLGKPAFMILLGEEFSRRRLAEQRGSRRVGLGELELSASRGSERTGEGSDSLASTCDLDASHPFDTLQSK